MSQQVATPRRALRVNPTAKLAAQVLTALIQQGQATDEQLSPLIECLDSGHLGQQREALNYLGILRPGTANWASRVDTLLDGVPVYFRQMPRLTRGNPDLSAVVSVVAGLSIGHHVEWTEISGTVFRSLTGLSLYRVKKVLKSAIGLGLIEKRAGTRKSDNHVTPNLYRVTDPAGWPKVLDARTAIGGEFTVVEKRKLSKAKKGHSRPRKRQAKSTTVK
jgi:hypothetical protein